MTPELVSILHSHSSDYTIVSLLIYNSTSIAPRPTRLTSPNNAQCICEAWPCCNGCSLLHTMLSRLSNEPPSLASSGLKFVMHYTNIFIFIRAAEHTYILISTLIAIDSKHLHIGTDSTSTSRMWTFRSVVTLRLNFPN